MGNTLHKTGVVVAIAAAIVAIAPGTAVGQQSQLIDAARPDRILVVARGYGSAELEKDNSGDPKITGRMDGTRYSLYFYGCKDGKACKAIQFHAGFEVKKKPSLEAINAYNQGNRFSRVYLDKDLDPIIEFDVNLLGGVSQKNLDDSFDWWRTVVKNFKKKFVDAE